MPQTITVPEQKTVVENKCRHVPDHECKVQTVVKDNPVNSTECKIVTEKECLTEFEPKEVKECRKIVEKKCWTVQEKVTEIVEVLSLYNLSYFLTIFSRNLSAKQFGRMTAVRWKSHKNVKQSTRRCAITAMKRR